MTTDLLILPSWKKCGLKSNLLEILYGISYPFSSPAQRFPSAVRPSSTFTSLEQQASFLLRRLRGTYDASQHHPHPLAAPGKAHGCTDGATQGMPNLPSLPEQGPSTTEAILTATDLPEIENTKHLVMTTVLALLQHYHITFWVS